MRHSVKSVVCVARDTGFVCLPLPSWLASGLASVTHFLPDGLPRPCGSTLYPNHGALLQELALLLLLALTRSPSLNPKPQAYRAQVKWTHLSKEDTTAKNEFGKAEALWGGDAKLAKKYEARMAGTKAANDFSRPAGKRRK